MQNNLEFLFSLMRAETILSRYLSGHGLDFRDFMILYYLENSREKRLRRIDLAEKMGFTASGITRMLLPLEKLHIIARDQDGDDARARYASLTEAGREMLRDATATLEMRFDDIFAAEDGPEIDNSRQVLDKIIAKING